VRTRVLCVVRERHSSPVSRTMSAGERMRSLSPERAGSPAVTLPRLAEDGSASTSDTLRLAELSESLKLAKQAREQQAVAEHIQAQLVTASFAEYYARRQETPRQGEHQSPPNGAAHQQLRNEMPTKQRAELAQPVIESALPPQADGVTSRRRSSTVVTGENVNAALAVATATMDPSPPKITAQEDSDIGMQSLLETESHALLILQFSDTGSAIMRTDLSRTDLLDECRNDIDPHRMSSSTRKLSKSTSLGQLAELEREPPAHSRSHNAAAGALGTASLANLHLRDLRYLQGSAILNETSKYSVFSAQIY
jgi:hypothetical protein